MSESKPHKHMLSLQIRVQLCNWPDHTTKKHCNMNKEEMALARRLAEALMVPSDQLSVSIESSTQLSNDHLQVSVGQLQQPTILVDIENKSTIVGFGKIEEVAAIVAVGMTCSVDRVFVSLT